MAHPQNSSRGLFSKARYDVAASGEVYMHDYSASSKLLSADSTGLVLAGGVKVSNKRHLTANSTGFIGTAEAAIPTTDEGAAFTLISNSTGVALAVNSTGTTWKYLNTTSVQPY